MFGGAEIPDAKGGTGFCIVVDDRVGVFGGAIVPDIFRYEEAY